MSAPPDAELWFLKALHTSVLLAAANGTLDLNQLARDELIRRGLDPEGEWVGPSRARELHHPNH
jgi:hypothetical protein